MTTSQLKNIILEAFVNVKLGGGISLKQAEVCDNYGRGVTEAEFLALPKSEITDSWRTIPLADLEKYAFISHLDAEGFRYYIPAFMISVLDDYDSSSMRVIGTLSGLYPKRDVQWDSWDYCMMHYCLLDDKQKEAIAIYLSELNNLLPLDLHHTRIIPRAVRNYWGQFLPKPKEE